MIPGQEWCQINTTDVIDHIITSEQIAQIMMSIGYKLTKAYQFRKRHN